MDRNGWDDPVGEEILLTYRRKGELRRESFFGAVGILHPEDPNRVKFLPREELPLRDGSLNLSAIPVVGIGGKRSIQLKRMREFLDKNPSFEGAFLLYPGSGSWDLGAGMLLFKERGFERISR